jgi:hypothetical protein
VIWKIILRSFLGDIFLLPHPDILTNALASKPPAAAR